MMSLRRWIQLAGEHFSYRRGSNGTSPRSVAAGEGASSHKESGATTAAEATYFEQRGMPRINHAPFSDRRTDIQPGSAIVSEPMRCPERLLLTFKETRDLEAALALEIGDGEDRPLISERRKFVSVSVGERDPADMVTRLSALARQYQGTLLPDFRYDLEPGLTFDSLDRGPDDPDNPSMEDVLARIKAPEAWSKTRGQDVVIAVVDTGIDGSRPEFPVEKRAGGFAPDDPQGDAWVDWQGHGTMCAAIAAGSRALGGAFDGVAPQAKIFSCKTKFFSSELVLVYDLLGEMAKTGTTVIATNSFGMRAGIPPAEDDELLSAALTDAIADGVHVFFSAGNNHVLAGGQPNQCQPNSIWRHKSRHDVFVVATCDLEGRIWDYSSRGPGQFFGDPGTGQKPDVTAPTPRNGRILYGNRIQVFRNGWGTSGACPQAAGLAALLLSVRPDLPRQQLFDIIRDSASPLGHSPLCEGAGLLNCDAALGRLPVG